MLLLAACQTGSLNGAIPGSLSRNTTQIAANGSSGAQDGVPGLVVPVSINGSPLIPSSPSIVASLEPLPTASASTLAVATPTPVATTITSTGSGGGGSSSGGSGGGGSVVIPPSPSPSPGATTSTTGFQNLHGQTFTLAGTGTAFTADGLVTTYDGLGPNVALNRPSGLTVDRSSGLVYFADTGVGLIRTLSLADIVHTKAGGRDYVTESDIVPPPASGPAYSCGTTSHSNDVNPDVNTWLHVPGDMGSNCNGSVSPDGTGTASRFGRSYGMDRDAAGDLYVADSDYGIRKIKVSDGSWQVSRFATGFRAPVGVVCDQTTGDIYVSDSSANCIYRLHNWTSGTAVTSANVFVGNINPGFSDGSGTNAYFNEPGGIVRTSAGVMFVADSGNNCIRRVDINGLVTTLCGSGVRGYADGNGANVRFWYPRGLTMGPDGALFVADSQNHAIRQISQSGNVTTVAGKPGNPGFADGANLSAAQFSEPQDVSVDGFGNLFVADAGNHRIRQIVR